LQNREEYLGERCQNRIENASIPRLFLELGSYGSIETPVFLTDRTPSVQVALQATFKDESYSWIACGAKGLAALGLGRPS